MRPFFEVSMCFNCCETFETPTEFAPIKCPRCGFSLDRVLYEDVIHWSRYPSLDASAREYDERCKRDPSLPQAVGLEMNWLEAFLLAAISSGLAYDMVKYLSVKILKSALDLDESNKKQKKSIEKIYESEVLNFLNILSNEETLQGERSKADLFYAACEPKSGSLSDALANSVYDKSIYLTGNPSQEFARLVPDFLAEQFQLAIREYMQSTVPKTPVYIVKEGRSYHAKDCKYMGQSVTLEIEMRSAELAGYQKCKICM